MDFADFSQPIKLAIIAKHDEIAAELSAFVSPPFLPGEYHAVLAIAAGALDTTTLTAEQIAYLPTPAQARTFRDAYLAARAQFNERTADLDAVVATAIAAADLDEEATLAAIAGV